MDASEVAGLADLERVILDPTAEPVSVPSRLLRRITSDFSDEIGAGGSSVVYKGVLPSGTPIAVKKFSQSSETAFLKEVDALMRAKHKNVVRIIGYCMETTSSVIAHQGKFSMGDTVVERFICLEYVPAGTLQDFIDKTHGLEIHWRYQLTKEICRSLHYLHEEAGIIHLDLKPNNILLDNRGMPKIYNFGCSRLSDEVEKYERDGEKTVGTPGFIAPEILLRGELSFKSDMYSFGCIIGTLFPGSTLSDDNMEQVIAHWRKRLENEGDTSSLEHMCLKVRRCLEIAFKCMENNPQERPTTQDVVLLLDDIERNDSTFGGTPQA